MKSKEWSDGNNMTKETFVRDIDLLHTDLLPFRGLDQQLEVRNNLNESDLSPEDAAMYEAVINIIDKHNINLIRYGLRAVDMGKIIIVNAKAFCGFLDSISPEPLESKDLGPANLFRFHIRNSILYGIVNQLSWYGDVSDQDSIQLNYLLDLLKKRPKIKELLIAKNLHQDDAFYEVEQVLQVAKQGYLQEFHWAKRMLLVSVMRRSHLSLGYESHSTKYLALLSSPSIMISNIEEHTDLIKNIYLKIQSFLRDPKLKVFAQQLCLDFDRFIKREFVHKNYNVQVLRNKKYDKVIDALGRYYDTLELYQKDIQQKHILDGVATPYYNFFAWEKFLNTLYSHQIRELAQALQAGTRTNDPVVSLFLEFIQTHPEIKPFIKLTLDNDYKHILHPQYKHFDYFEKALVECIDQNKDTKQIEQQLKKGLGEFLMQHHGVSILQTLRNLKNYVQSYGMFDYHVPGYAVKRKLLDLSGSQQKNIIAELSKLKDQLKPFHKYIAADTLFMLCSGYYIRRALRYFQELKYRVVVGTECTAPYLQDYSQGTISLAEYAQRMGSEHTYLEQLLWNIDYHIEAIEFFMSKTTDI